jgi:benzoate-CoA ligase
MPENLTRSLLDRHLSDGRGEQIAVRDPKRAWSYSRLAEEANRFGAALVETGINPGDRVALMMYDSLELTACFLGAARIGAVPMTVSTLLRHYDVKAILSDARPRVMVLHDDFTALIDEVSEELPSAPEIYVVGARAGEHATLAAFLDEQGNDPCEVNDVEAPSLLLYSGGSGGPPRGVAHTADAVRASYHAYAQKVLGITTADRVFSTARLFTAYGLGAGLLFPLMAGASSYFLPERIRPRNVFEGLVQWKPSIFAAAPSFYAQMLHDYTELTAPRPTCFQPVRAAISGAEPLTAELWRRIRDTFGVEVLHGFGSTEALHFFFSNRPDAKRPGASGKLVEGYEARIIDDSGKPVRGMEIGELEIRGPSVAKGYWRNTSGGSTANRKAPGPDLSPRVFLSDGWLHTGDRFFVDPDGWFYYSGRVDDHFKVSGKWVVPAEVEATLLSHPAVWECAVVGQDDADGLTIPVAYVVTNVGHEPTDDLGRELMEYVKSEIAPYKYPRRVEFVAELPKGQAGKVQRWRLRLPTG